MKINAESGKIDSPPTAVVSMDFGTYLRTARESRRLTLDELSRTTKIKRDLLIDLERNNVSRWPRHRVYRHGYLRAYANAVGLNPTTVLARFDDEFGDPHPAAFHGPPRKPGTPRAPQRVPHPFAGNAILTGAVAVVVGALIGVLASLTGPATRERTPARSTPRVPGVLARQVQPRDLVAPALMAAAESSAALAQPDLRSAPDTTTPDVQAPIETNADEVMDDEIEGELRIASTPPAAHVTINGIGRGATPLRVRYLPAGTYTVRLILPGYRIRETRVVLSREQPVQSVRVALREAPAFATAAFRAPAQ